MRQTRSFGGTDKRVPGTDDTVHVREINDPRFSVSFEPRYVPLEHNNTVRAWMDWIQRHIEQVYESKLSELDEEVSVKFSTENQSEQGLQQLSMEDLDYVTGGGRGDKDRVNRMLDGQDDRIKYTKIGAGGYGASVESEGGLSIDFVFCREMLEDAVDFIYPSVVSGTDYRREHKIGLHNNIAEYVEG